MKSKFPAYYRIHRDDILKSFDDCIFMFDASALLNVFRLKPDVAEKVFNVIDHYKNQIRVPYHVAEEYNRRIHKVLNEQLSKIQSSKKSFKAFISTFEAKRNMPYISEETKRMIDALDIQIKEEYSQQEKYIEDQLVYGKFQNRMADLLEGKVLKPFTEEEIKAIEKEGAERYSNKIPPGFKDAAKQDNRFGDLINWKEILKFAKSNDKSIIFVTNDEKEDWVCKENEKTVGPLYDLLTEFYREIGGNSHFFHIYTLDRFLDVVKEKDKELVSTEVVEEVKELIENNEEDIKAWIEGQLTILRYLQPDVFCSPETKKAQFNSKGVLEGIKASITPVHEIRCVSDNQEGQKATAPKKNTQNAKQEAQDKKSGDKNSSNNESH